MEEKGWQFPRRVLLDHGGAPVLHLNHGGLGHADSEATHQP